eukprot:4055720-Alexandrium_andersonii.AAC.1
MSASLVGSEMCIRDRHRPLSIAAVAYRAWALARYRDYGSAAAALLHAGPVSYTHLTLPTICSV